MRWLFGLFLLVACAAHPQQRISPPAPGALALVETATDLAGKPIGASPAHSTVVIVLASWCEHCAAEIATLDTLRKLHPDLRIIGVSYHEHENYDHRGNPEALRRYAGNHSWLPIVLADDALFEALGSPPMIPAVFVFDHAGGLIGHFDRRTSAEPNRREIEDVLARAGA